MIYRAPSPSQPGHNNNILWSYSAPDVMTGKKNDQDVFNRMSSNRYKSTMFLMYFMFVFY